MHQRRLIRFATLLAFAVVTPAAHGAVVPIAWWPGDGNADDRIGNYDGFPRNGAGFATGMIGQAFSFDGVDDYVWVPNTTAIDGGPEATYMAWVYPDVLPGAGTYYTLLNGGDSTHPTWITQQARLLYWNQSGEGRFYMDCATMGIDDSYTSRYTAGTYAPGNWYFVVAVFDNGIIDLYVNAVLDNGTVVSNSPGTVLRTDAYNQVSIGAGVRFDESLVASPFAGLMDEAAIYGVALGAAEINEVYTNGIEPALGIYSWGFEDAGFGEFGCAGGVCPP